MKELNGLKYSREIFDDYKYRAIASFKKDEEIHRLDIYTTDESKSSVIDVLVSSTQKGVDFVGIEYWGTKEQDEIERKFIEDWLD